MALADIAMFRAIHDSTVLVNPDANRTAALEACVRARVIDLYSVRRSTRTPWSKRRARPAT